MSKRPGTNADRDVYVAKTPAGGVPAVPWHEEVTGVHTDGQVFRAIKGLRDDLEANKLEAARAHGALKTEVLGLKTTVDKMDDKLDRLAESNARLEGRVEERSRSKSPSGSRPSIVDVVEAQLDKRENAEHKDRREFRRRVALLVLSGFSSGVVVVWLLQHFLGGH